MRNEETIYINPSPNFYSKQTEYYYPGKTVKEVMAEMRAQEAQQSAPQGSVAQSLKQYAQKLPSRIGAGAGGGGALQSSVPTMYDSSGLGAAGSTGNWVSGITGALNTNINTNRKVIGEDKKNMTQIISSFLGGGGAKMLGGL